MYCIKCGTRLPDNANFCINCGAKVEQRLQPNNLIEYYRSMIDFSFTKIEMTDGYNHYSNNKKIEYLKAFDDDVCYVFDFSCNRIFAGLYNDFDFIIYNNIEYFLLQKGNKWALMTKQGFLTQFIYDKIGTCMLAPGYVCVTQDEKHGIINLTSGKTVFDCIFDDIGHRCTSWPDDCFTVKKDNKWGAISIIHGTILIPFIYKNEYDVSNNHPNLI